MTVDQSELDSTTLLRDAVTAIEIFGGRLTIR